MRSVTLMTLEDAAHFSADDREALLAKYPAHERDVRGKGIPMLGSGRIFPLSDEQVSCPAFKVPEYWPVLGALDFGWDHPTAAVRLAHDRDADIVYVTHTYRQAKGTPIQHAGALRAWGNIPWAWPHDGEHETSAGGGVDLATQYRAQGLDMLAERAKPEKLSRKAGQSPASSSMEAGLMSLLDRMLGGRLKVFEHLGDWFEEFRLYHRKKGKVVKFNDDLMSATRYGEVSLRYARVVGPMKKKRGRRASAAGWMGA
jgi:hypothetical protein